ncbi:hypothetical protein AK812_SmicGene17552 [Symbiodinium microadriaticum]|uniref:Uncharacterized protein n=1 Tax=Symbiodinium microadriaticum TaxID=2951 RepID=A0A1Q9DXG6_SYMMI|nr:hypothetical protein AK812_SmicGene17552 [Symbiodinium microadriaticum]
MALDAGAEACIAGPGEWMLIRCRSLEEHHPGDQKEFSVEKLQPREVPAAAGVKGVKRPADDAIPEDTNTSSKKLAEELFGPVDDL